MALTKLQMDYVLRRFKKPDETKAASALAVGCPSKSASTRSTQLENNPSVYAALQLGHLNLRTDVSLQRAIEKSDVEGALMLILERCLDEGPIYADEPDENGDYKYLGYKQFNAAGATKAAELLGKSKGMFTDKIALETSGEVTTKHELSPALASLLDEVYKS